MPAEPASRHVDLTTLVITAIASAAAAYACSKIWAPGTLFSAAFTPVLVAIIKEGLRRPSEVVTRAVPARGVVRSARARSERSVPRQTRPEAPSSRATGGERQSPRAPAPGQDATRVAQAGMVPGASPPSRRAIRWRLAIITGLLGFVICAAVLTVPELVAGGSAAGGGRQTTLFGGHSKSGKRDKHQSTTIPAPTRTAPQRKTTVPAPSSTAPAPASPVPAPAGTTPAPAAPQQPAPAAPPQSQP